LASLAWSLIVQQCVSSLSGFFLQGIRPNADSASSQTLIQVSGAGFQNRSQGSERGKYTANTIQ
jgi:hypothetical protein